MRHCGLWLTGLLAACAPSVADSALWDASVPDPLGPLGAGSQRTAVMSTVSEDYAVGALATVSLEDWSIQDAIADISGDPVVSASGGYVLQLDRLGVDTVRVYAPDRFREPLVELALDSGANPHDARLCGGELFVSQYGRPELAVFDLELGLRLGKVDLSPWDDGDGSPEASRMVSGPEGDLYVGLHMLDREADWASAGGAVLRIDCAQREVVDSWELASPDVYADPSDPSVVWIYAQADGIYRLDAESGELSERRLSHEALGASVQGLAIAGEQAVLATVSASWEYAIGCADLAAGVYSEVESSAAFLYGVSANDRQEAWISARTHWENLSAPTGAIIYDIPSCSSRTGSLPLSPELAPTDVAFY